MVLWDNEAKPILSYYDYIEADNNMDAKLKGLWLGFQFCLKEALNIIWIESDSNWLVNVLNKKGNTNWKLDLILDDVQNLFDQNSLAMHLHT